MINHKNNYDDDNEISEYWKEHKENLRKSRTNRLNKFNDFGWTKHSEYHYSIILDGFRLDAWPSRCKFMYKGKVHWKGMDGFIKNKLRRDK